ncbi:hypothetical protein LA76x_2862 [Lysobacter antibioticus]|uniref:Uncharacterized protein n=1 Tax=Lysobacter antibioticus TaxID=84531 RepID=A0A0S2FBU0_LYSAN|nr:hypothetical protein LA76x_2862 [Lysobacter antibioticus]
MGNRQWALAIAAICAHQSGSPFSYPQRGSGRCVGVSIVVPAQAGTQGFTEAWC